MFVYLKKKYFRNSILCQALGEVCYGIKEAKEKKILALMELTDS